MKIKELRAKRATLLEDARAITDRAAAEGRSLTSKENESFDRCFAECDELRAHIDKLLKLEEAAADGAKLESARSFIPVGDDGTSPGFYSERRSTSSRKDSNPPLILRTERGEDVRALESYERMTSRHSAPLPDGIRPDELDFGRAIRGLILGDWRGAEAERRAMSVGSSTAGGFSVPEILSSQVVDLARNKSSVTRAGARTIPMDASTLKLVTVDSDPVPAWKAENAAIAVTQGSLGLITLTAKTLAAITPISKELVQDGANISAIVTDLLAASMANALDLAILRGAGGLSIPGIRTTTGVQVLDLGTDGAAVTLDDFSEAVQLISAVNGPETGLSALYSSRTGGEIDRLKDLEGRYLSANGPASWQNLRKFVSNQIPENLTHGTADNSTEAYVGDFSQVLIGMRQNLVIEVSDNGSIQSPDLGFHTGTVFLRSWLRADAYTLRPNHMVVLEGIIPPA